MISVKWKWRICFTSVYFVINRTCPNISLLYALSLFFFFFFFFSFLAVAGFFFFLSSPLLLYFILSPFSFVQTCTKCYLPFKKKKKILTVFSFNDHFQ